MRFLFNHLQATLPTNNGGRLRVWSILRALAAEGHEIHLVMFAESEEIKPYRTQLDTACREVIAIPLKITNWSTGTNYLGRLRGLMSPTPFGASRFRSTVAAECIASMAAREKYDAIMIETAYGMVNRPEFSASPIILVDQNIEHTVVKRYVETERNPVRRAYAWLEWQKLERWERQVSGACAQVWVCSEVDRRALREMCPQTAAPVIPNVVDVETYVSAAQGDGRTLLYVGGLDYLPNRDAVEFFTNRILPELRELAHNFRFAVAYSPEHAGVSAFRNRFEGTPEVEFVEARDIREQIGEAAIFVVPLRIGSGTRFKILEAAASAKAIVSTRVGAEGLDFVDGTEIILEDDPLAFAQAVAALLADEARRSAMGAAARRRVEQQYDFAALRKAVTAALGALKHPAGARV
jgi:glycosyltransferase involved in cell wall biosynthesis